jgi:Protein of unknown function (DUF3177)
MHAAFLSTLPFSSRISRDSDDRTHVVPARVRVSSEHAVARHASAAVMRARLHFPQISISSQAKNVKPTSSEPSRKATTTFVATAAIAAATVMPAGRSLAATVTISDAISLTTPLFEPLNAASSLVIRSLVWADFRVAVAIFVIVPLVLFGWSIAEQRGADDAVKRILVGYWEASSLLMLTVFLDVAEVPFASFTGMFVQALIVISLSFWKDLLEEARASKAPIARVFKVWRLAAVFAATGGVAVQLPFQGCNFASPVSGNPMCAVWLEPPAAFHTLLFPNVAPDTMQVLATTGCAIYFTYLGYLTAFVLPKIGRSGRANRNMFSSVSLLRTVGLISEDSEGN